MYHFTRYCHILCVVAKNQTRRTGVRECALVFTLSENPLKPNPVFAHRKAVYGMALQTAFCRMFQREILS
jgi:hypothetical protein